MILKFYIHGLTLNSVFFLIIAQPGVFCKKCQNIFKIFEIWESGRVNLYLFIVKMKLKYKGGRQN